MLIHKETKTQLQPEKTMHPRSLSSSLRYYKAMQEKATSTVFWRAQALT